MALSDIRGRFTGESITNKMVREVAAELQISKQIRHDAVAFEILRALIETLRFQDRCIHSRTQQEDVRRANHTLVNDLMTQLYDHGVKLEIYRQLTDSKERQFQAWHRALIGGITWDGTEHVWRYYFWLPPTLVITPRLWDLLAEKNPNKLGGRHGIRTFLNPDGSEYTLSPAAAVREWEQLIISYHVAGDIH